MQAYLEDERNVTYVDSIVEFNETVLAPLDKPGVITVSLKGSQMYLMLITNVLASNKEFQLLVEQAEAQKCAFNSDLRELLQISLEPESLYADYPNVQPMYAAWRRSLENSYALVLMSLTEDKLSLDGYLVGEITLNKKESISSNCPEGKCAEIVLLATKCESVLDVSKREKYYYVSDEGRLHFGAFIVTIFESLMLSRQIKAIYLESARNPDTMRFYNSLGYTRYMYSEPYLLKKDLSSESNLERWEHVLVERQQKMQDVIGNALMLTRGNIAAAALLVYHYPVV